MYQIGFEDETFETSGLEQLLKSLGTLIGARLCLADERGQLVVGHSCLSLGDRLVAMARVDAENPTDVRTTPGMTRGAAWIELPGRPSLYLLAEAGQTGDKPALGAALIEATALIQMLIRKELQLDGLARETLLRYEELNLLYEMGESIILNMTIDETVAQMLDKAVASTDAQGGLIALLEDGDAEAGRLTVRAATGWGNAADLKGRHFSSTEGLLGEAVSQRRPRIFGDVLEEQVYGTPLSPAMVRSLLFIPLYTSARLVGSMILVNKRHGEHFSASDEKLGLAIATQAAIAIENSRLQSRIREEERIGASLQRYVSPNVLRAVIESGGLQDLIGDSWKATIVFIDIRGFSEVVEKTAPEVMIALLNEYFRAMTDIIFRYQGAIDEFAGDELLAFFGIPLATPHGAENAVRAAIDMVERMDELKAEWIARGLPTFDIGVGLNTGWVAVGNIGSDRRMELTVVGPPVVIASRVEELNKDFGTRILITEATLDEVRDVFEVRPLGPQALKGISQLTNVFEVVGFRDSG